MAHFAQLDENNTVVQVIVVSNDDCKDVNGVETESIGVSFCQKLVGGAESVWKQTSYHDSFRGNYAGIGYKYHENVATLGVASTDVFLPPKPHDSWVLDLNQAVWVCPLGSAPIITQAQVEANQYYYWDEDAYQADTSDPKTVGWVLGTRGE